MIFADFIYLYIGLALIGFVMLLAFRARRLKKKALREFISPKLQKQLAYSFSKLASTSKFLVLIFGIAFLFMAMAKPQWGSSWQETKSKGADVIFAIDCSKSMLSDDLKPNRLERAKLAIEDALLDLKSDRIGIVAFSGEAFLQCPLTLDYRAFRMSLNAVSTNSISRGGTNISAAITEAQSAFKASTGTKNIILLSDGEELEQDAISLAKELSEEGIRIYTIGVGDTKLRPLSYRNQSGNLEYLRDRSGAVIESQLDEERLIQIAQSTGAFYGRLDAGAMQRAIDEIQKESQELSSKMQETAIERYQIFLAIALVLLCLESLIGTRKLFVKKLKNIALNKLSCFLLFGLCLIVLPKNMQAQENPREIFNAGVLTQQNGDLEGAKALYKKAINEEAQDMTLHAKALYNIANIDYKQAEESFKNIEDISEATQTAAATLGALDNNLSQSESILTEGKRRQESDIAQNTNTLEEEEIQNAIKQSIQSLEGTLRSFENFKKAKSAKVGSLSALAPQLKAVENKYASATDLDPSFENAKKNLAQSQAAQAMINKEIKALNDFENSAKQSIENSKEIIPTRIEELKKLLKKEDNQDNQEQNQDNQQSQENKDKQDSQQSQDSQDSQDNQEQNQDNQEQNQDNQQSQDSQNQENKDNQDSQQEQEQNSQDNQEQNQEQDSQEGSEPNSQNQDFQENSQGNEQNQAQDSQSQQAEQGEEEKQEQGEAQDGEQTEQQAEEEVAISAQDFRKAEGAMTQREALQLLESAQGKHKYLPLNRGKNYYRKDYKDW